MQSWASIWYKDSTPPFTVRLMLSKHIWNFHIFNVVISAFPQVWSAFDIIRHLSWTNYIINMYLTFFPLPFMRVAPFSPLRCLEKFPCHLSIAFRSSQRLPPTATGLCTKSSLAHLISLEKCIDDVISKSSHNRKYVLLFWNMSTAYRFWTMVDSEHS